MDNNQKEIIMEEKDARSIAGMPMLILNSIVTLASVLLFIWAIVKTVEISERFGNVTFYVLLIVLSTVYYCIIGPILFAGLKVLKPREALVLTFFGNYYGTLKGPGFFFVNPFTTSFNPAASSKNTGGSANEKSVSIVQLKTEQSVTYPSWGKKKISLKTMTLDNEKQKINDLLGNPIIIGIVVIWRVVNTAKAVFNVDDYALYLSIQCDSALRNIVRLYPYDITGEEADNEKSLRGSSQEIAERLKNEIQSKVDIAGLVIDEARITHLAYAPEIAAAMLQRQQATAIVAARQMIVEGAVGMVEMALSKLNDKDIVKLDEERKAAMVSNLLVVLCGNKDPQPIVNSGSLY